MNVREYDKNPLSQQEYPNNELCELLNVGLYHLIVCTSTPRANQTTTVVLAERQEQIKAAHVPIEAPIVSV